MQRVFRVDERLATMAKPLMQPVNEIRLIDGDSLVVCAGFEDRAVEVLRLAASVASGFKIFIIEYLPPYADNRIDELLAICKQSRLAFERLTYDRKSPAGFGELLVERIERNSGRLFIDISGMSRLLIVQILVALYNRGEGFSQCFIAYEEAQSYPPVREEVEAAIRDSDSDPMLAALFLSCGVFGVTVVPELSPASLGANQSRLVIFPSFNVDQLTALRAELQPSRFAYIHGIPPRSENKWRTDAIARLNHLGDISREGNFRVSTFDYRETLDCLLKIYVEHGIRDRLLVSPTGSKMQAVAVGLFRAYVEDVQIVYPTPREFRSPNKYTTGVGQLYILPLVAFSKSLR